jgi:pentatricopeptide repeat protein
MYKASRICSRVFTATIRKRHLTTVQQRFNIAHKYRSLEESTEKQLFLKNPERMDRFVLRQLLKDWLWFFRSLASDEKEFRPKIAYNAELLARKILTEKELGNQGPDCPEELCSTIRILSKIDEPKKAENLLQMLEDTNAVNLLSLLQKELAYSSVIQAWSQKGDNFSFHRARHWFQKIENPPLQAYNSILNAYANRGKAHEAGNLFLQMQKSENVMPSAISYCIVMKAWVRSNRRDAQEMVENLLEELKFAYISQGCPPSLLPNGVVYGVAMSLASAKRATSLLQELCDSYQLIKIPELTPTILHYMIAMKAWAKDGKPHEAERLLMEMKNAYESGNDTLRPEYQVRIPYVV